MFESAVFVLAFLAFLAATIVQSFTLLTLKSHHQDYYRRLGEPPAFFVSPLKIGASWSFFIYIIANEYQDDEIPSAAATAFPILRLLYYVFFASLTLLLVNDVFF